MKLRVLGDSQAGWDMLFRPERSVSATTFLAPTRCFPSK